MKQHARQSDEIEVKTTLLDYYSVAFDFKLSLRVPNLASSQAAKAVAMFLSIARHDIKNLALLSIFTLRSRSKPCLISGS